MSFRAYSTIQPSGVNWLGDIPQTRTVWRSKRLFDHRNERAHPGDRQMTASQKYGVIYQEDYEALEGMKVMQVVNNHEILKHVEAGDFVISMRSFQGGLEYSNNTGSVSSAYVAIKPTVNALSSFYKYLFKSKTYIQALQSTTNLVRDGQALRYSNFVQVDLPLPPLNEQQTIARFLERETAKIDELIGAQEDLIRLLKEKRQAVISHAVTKGLDPNAPMKPSGIEWLGDIPAHWEWGRIKNYCRHITDGAHISPETENGVQPFVSTRDVKAGNIDLENCLRTSETTFEYMVKTGCNPIAGDLLFSKDGTIGETAVVRDLPPFVVASSLIILRPDGRKCDVNFLNLFCKSAACLRQVESFVKGAALPRLSIKNLRNVFIAAPPLSEQEALFEAIAPELDKFDTLIREASDAIRLLSERRAALISAAVTGKIDVRGAVDMSEDEAIPA